MSHAVRHNPPGASVLLTHKRFLHKTFRDISTDITSNKEFNRWDRRQQRHNAISVREASYRTSSAFDKSSPAHDLERESLTLPVSCGQNAELTGADPAPIGTICPGCVVWGLCPHCTRHETLRALSVPH